MLDQQDFTAKLVELLLPDDWEKAAQLADLIDERIIAMIDKALTEEKGTN
jgi:hypothetical protein